MWWFLDRPLAAHIVRLASEAAPSAAAELAGVPCLFDGKPLSSTTVDPTGVRFALAILRARGQTTSSSALALLAERAALESAVLYDMLDKLELDKAPRSVAKIATQLVLVAPVRPRDRGAPERRLAHWLDVNGKAWSSMEAPPPEGAWLLTRVRDLAPVHRALAFVRSADTKSELADDQQRIADALAHFLTTSTGVRGN